MVIADEAHFLKNDKAQVGAWCYLYVYW
jgi:hypothetical protein